MKLGERVAILETKIEHVGTDVHALRTEFRQLDEKLDEILLKLVAVEKRSIPPKSSPWTLSSTAKQAIGGVIGATFLYIIQAVTGTTLPAAPPSSARAEQTPSDETVDAGP